ncbi:hypothetical protein, partial [Bartonella elizabethae]
MSLNEILSIAIFAMLLIDAVMFGFALYYRNQVKALKKEIEDEEFAARALKKEREEIREIISGYDENIEKYEEEIKRLKETRDEYRKTLQRKNQTIDKLIAEIETLKDEHKEALEQKYIALCCQFEENRSLNKKIEKLTQELKQRDASVNKP